MQVWNWVIYDGLSVMREAVSSWLLKALVESVKQFTNERKVGNECVKGLERSGKVYVGKD